MLRELRPIHAPHDVELDLVPIVARQQATLAEPGLRGDSTRCGGMRGEAFGHARRHRRTDRVAVGRVIGFLRLIVVFDTTPCQPVERDLGREEVRQEPERRSVACEVEDAAVFRDAHLVPNSRSPASPRPGMM